MIADLNRFLKTLPWSVKALLAFGLFALTFVISVGAVAAVIARLPADYFREDYVSPLAEQHPVVRWIGVVVKNAAGALLVVLGLLLSLPGIPGQGLLTILIGVMLLDFPGTLPWLLEGDDPGVRYLALRELAEHAKPAELRAARHQAHTVGPIAAV